MSIQVTWLGHASFKIVAGGTVVYIDPWKIGSAVGDADFVLVSHSHFDHYSADDIAAVSKVQTQLIASADVVAQQGGERPLRPGETLDPGPISVTGVPAYNPKKQFHPRANDWLGFIVEIEGRRIYYAGDTDVTEEMKALAGIDLALLPVGGTYTCGPDEAAAAVNTFAPGRAIPYHWGDIVGDRSDAEAFAEKATVPTAILTPGESLVLD